MTMTAIMYSSSNRTELLKNQNNVLSRAT